MVGTAVQLLACWLQREAESIRDCDVNAKVAVLLADLKSGIQLKLLELVEIVCAERPTSI